MYEAEFYGNHVYSRNRIGILEKYADGKSLPNTMPRLLKIYHVDNDNDI